MIAWGTVGILALVLCVSIWIEDTLSRSLLGHMKDARVRLENVTMMRRDVRKTQLALVEDAVLAQAQPDRDTGHVRALMRAANARTQAVLSLPARTPEESQAADQLGRAFEAWRQASNISLSVTAPSDALPRLKATHERVDAAAEDLVELSSNLGASIDAQLVALQRGERLVHLGSFLVMALTLAVALRSWRRSMQAEAQFRSSEQARSALKAMAASVAHEVNNQLGVLQNSIGLLRKARVDEALLRFQEESVDQIQRLTRDLNSFSVRTPRPPEMLDVHKLAKATAHHFGSQVEVHGTGPVWLFADASSLARALLNVIKNGVEAGGPVSLYVDDGPAEVCIRCVDSGPGVDRASAARLGEPFFTTKAQGTGLGLTLVQSVLAEHGGSFTLTSLQDRGAEATMRIPRRRSAAAAHPDAHRRSAR